MFIQYDIESSRSGLFPNLPHTHVLVIKLENKIAKVGIKNRILFIQHGIEFVIMQADKQLIN